MGVLKPLFQKNPCKCFVETATSYPEPPHLVPELPHLVTKPPHLTAKAKLHNMFFCGRFMRDVVLSKLFFFQHLKSLLNETNNTAINKY